MQLDKFIISAAATLRDALQHIEANHHGLIFITDANGAVCGVATDGDIRRRLLDGGTLEDAITQCANPDFVWENPATPRELLLKKLDHRIRVIPLLDAARRLVGLVSRDHLPIQEEGAVYARARAPVRISFGGGGSDLTHYFSSNEGGAVINTSISLYSHATLRIREDEKVIINSLDLGETLQGDDLPSALAAESRFRLIQALLRVIRPDFGFELFLHSDFPMNSGLGGSAVVSAAVLGCFNQFRRDQWDPHELAEIAYQAERHYLGVGEGKARQLSQGEMINRENLGKSLVAAEPLRQGTVLMPEHIKVRSPGQGLSPQRYENLIGRTLRHDMGEEDFFFPSDLQDARIEPRQYRFTRPWGVPVRYHDFREYASRIQPDLWEFHLSYSDRALVEQLQQRNCLSK